MSINIRLINKSDLSAVVAIQDSCYGDELFEDASLIQRRLASQPDSCWLAENHSKEVLAYLFSYPARDKQVAALGSEFPRYTEAELLYLHDMAVGQNARSLGLASRLLGYAEQHAVALGFSRLALVAVQGSVPYWQKHGFVVVNLSSPEAAKALASYSGQNAMYMQKSLAR